MILLQFEMFTEIKIHQVLSIIVLLGINARACIDINMTYIIFICISARTVTEKNGPKSLFRPFSYERKTAGFRFIVETNAKPETPTI